jgi:hypothetical protein
MRESLEKIFLTLAMGILFSLAACSQTPNGLQGLGEEVQTNAAGPIDRPTLPVDSGPQIDCRKIRSDPEDATPEQIKTCENVILPEDLPSAKDAHPNIPTLLPPPSIVPNNGFPTRINQTVEEPEIVPTRTPHLDDSIEIEPPH